MWSGFRLPLHWMFFRILHWGGRCLDTYISGLCFSLPVECWKYYSPSCATGFQLVELEPSCVKDNWFSWNRFLPLQLSVSFMAARILMECMWKMTWYIVISFNVTWSQILENNERIPSCARQLIGISHVCINLTVWLMVIAPFKPYLCLETNYNSQLFIWLGHCMLIRVQRLFCSRFLQSAWITLNSL